MTYVITKGKIPVNENGLKKTKRGCNWAGFSKNRLDLAMRLIQLLVISYGLRARWANSRLITSLFQIEVFLDN